MVEPYNQDRIDRLGDPNAFRYCSGEELRDLLAPAPEWQVADFGSGTGLFTTELARVVDAAFAVDIRHGVHERYREAGMPANVVPVIADMNDLPFPDDRLDGGVSIRTYHHGADEALSEVARVIRPGGRLVIVDWSATGAGEREFGTDEEYFDLATVQAQLLDEGFRIRTAKERRETFVVVGEQVP